MQFRIPQFIEIEDKIFGPFTWRQFIYMAGGAGLAFVIYKLLPLIIAAPIIVAVVSLALALTFAKVNGRPFALALENFFSYLFKNKMYLWKKRPSTTSPPPNLPLTKREEKGGGPTSPKLTGSKLRELSWSLDILEMKKK